MNTTIIVALAEIAATSLAELGMILYLLKDEPKRLVKRRSRFFALLGFMAVFSLLYLFLRENLGWGFYVFFTYIFSAANLLFILAVYDLNLNETVYFTLLSLLCVIPLRHLIRGLYGTVRACLGTADRLYLLPYNLVFTMLEAVGLFFIYTYARRFTKRHSGEGAQRGWPQLFWMFLTILPVIFLVNIEQWIPIDGEDKPISVHFICELLGLCSLMGVLNYDNRIAVARKEQELDKLETMLMNQRQQYELKKEAVSSINRRYHDLKNHLLYLNGSVPAAERDAYIAELKSQIESFEAIQNTGNEAIDVMLTGKKLVCAEQGINMLIILDGSKLAFMRPIDVATIFGNALDNAITALHTASEDKRTVTVRMSERDTWLILRFENYCGSILRWENGLPVSTKEETLHGIGLRSIRYAAEQYGGHITAEQKDGLFVLNVLLPRPGESKTEA